MKRDPLFSKRVPRELESLQRDWPRRERNARPCVCHCRQDEDREEPLTPSEKTTRLRETVLLGPGWTEFGMNSMLLLSFVLYECLRVIPESSGLLLGKVDKIR